MTETRGRGEAQEADPCPGLFGLEHTVNSSSVVPSSGHREDVLVFSSGGCSCRAQQHQKPAVS